MKDIKTVSIAVKMTEEQLRWLDRWRAFQLDVPSRPEAVRRLIESATLPAENPHV
jgi:hypothetical protein